MDFSCYIELGDRMIDFVMKDEFNQVRICENQGVVDYPKTIRYLLNQLCSMRLSSLEATIEASRIHLRFQKMVPVYCTSNCLMFPLVGRRGKRSLFINYFSIHSIQYLNQEARITFEGFHVLSFPQATILKKQIIKCEKIILFMNQTEEK